MGLTTERLAYSDSYWDDALCNIGALSSGAVPADPINFGPSGTRPKVYGFGVGEDMDGTMQLSHRYLEGTDIRFHVHWAPAGSGGGNVQWELSYYWLNVDTEADAAPTVITTEVAAGTTAWKHQIAGFTALTGTGKHISSILVFKIKRIAASSSELASDAALLSVDAHFEIDSPGSRETLTK